jgi:hypothetical protein
MKSLLKHMAESIQDSRKSLRKKTAQLFKRNSSEEKVTEKKYNGPSWVHGLPEEFRERSRSASVCKGHEEEEVRATGDVHSTLRRLSANRKIANRPKPSEEYRPIAHGAGDIWPMGKYPILSSNPHGSPKHPEMEEVCDTGGAQTL